MALRKFEIIDRAPYAQGRQFGTVGAFEQLDGTAHFIVDPLLPANAAIVDLELIPRDCDGMVHFSADLCVIVPVDASRSNGRALVDLPNRGRRLMVVNMNQSPPAAPVARQAHAGDGFLFEQGYTVASIGWQWDVYRSDALMGLDAPSAMRDGEPISGETMVEFRPNEAVSTFLLADRVHKPLPAAPGPQPQAVLYVSDYEDAADVPIERGLWRFADGSGAGAPQASQDHIYLEGGFVPGKIYQLVYTTERAPVAGLGLLAMRDVAPFLRDRLSVSGESSGVATHKHHTLITWGISQTGRMLRHFLSLGLNLCEDGTKAYEGVHSHIAGARRGAFNHRFAQPSNQTTPSWGHVFPFADATSEDPVSGRSGGLLDRLDALNATPKIIYTNSAAEYWRGDATLAHTLADGCGDLEEHPATRNYLFASTQHLAGYIGQSRTNAGVGTTARYPLNVLDYRPLLRAALINLDRWISADVEPPPSQHPRLRDGSAVSRDQVLAYFTKLPAFACPDAQRLPFVRTVDLGADESVGVGKYPAKEGAFYPALVSALDADGNETAGVRLPDVTVPVATYAGWNPRDPATGSPDQIVPMNGSTLFFARTVAEREGSGDPRRAVVERYRDAQEYAQLVRDAATQLADANYLLRADVELLVVSALQRYHAAMGTSTA